MINNYKNIFVIDLEATCSSDNSINRNDMEIIEFAGVMVNVQEFEIIGKYTTFVKPVINSKLTDYCVNLTHISQSCVDAAKYFPEAMNELYDWLSSYDDFCLGAWGMYDKRQILKDCARHNISCKLNLDAYFNLKHEFSKTLGRAKRYGLRRGLTLIGQNFEGTPHRGLDDAVNTVKFLPYILNHKTLT